MWLVAADTFLQIRSEDGTRTKEGLLDVNERKKMQLCWNKIDHWYKENTNKLQDSLACFSYLYIDY